MPSRSERFHQQNLSSLCDELASRDKDLLAIIHQYGYPPCWERPVSFASLLQIILEQQVSLASARAAYDRIASKLGNITPEGLLTLTDQELRDCYFSRQKTGYARNLANALISKSLVLEQLPALSDDEIRQQLTAIKGIGNWTVDIFLLMCLHSSNVFPFGDIAQLNSLKFIKQLPHQTPIDQLKQIVNEWQPYRGIGAYLLWHAYICRKGIVF
jgi:DNA-3-methyladenine glycosylase II